MITGAALFTAIKEDKDTDIATWLQNGQIDVNEKHKDSYPVIFAAYYGRVGIVQSLVHSRADLRNMNQYGETALDAAKKGNQPAVVAVLSSNPPLPQTPTYVITNLPKASGMFAHVDEAEIARAIYQAFGINTRNKVTFLPDDASNSHIITSAARFRVL